MFLVKTLLLISLSLNSFANSASENKSELEQGQKKWQKHISLVDEDIGLIKATKIKDISIYIRLLELYGEKLELYIERENFFLLNSSLSEYKKHISDIEVLKKDVFKELLNLSNILLKKTKNVKILAKVYYYRAENYYLLKNKKQFYVDIKKAERMNNDETLKFRINQRLADYYFNEQKYKQASKYYEKLIKNENDKWISKYLYNLGWSYLKLNNYQDSLISFKRSITTSKMPGYFNIGEQAINSLMFAFVVSGNEKNGYDYLEEENLINFKRGIIYLDYVFEHGDKKQAQALLERIEKLVSNIEDLNQFIISHLVIHRNLKMFKTLNEYLDSLRGNEILIKAGGFNEEVVTNLRSYAGYLQELLRNKTYLNENLRSALVLYAINTFQILSEFNAKRAIEYKFFQGEVYLSNEVYISALEMYKQAVLLMKDPKQYKVADLYTEKVFQSLFMTISKMANPEIELVFSYDNYISYGKNEILKKQVFQKYLALLVKSEDGAFVKILKLFNAKYPANRPSQISYYKLYVNELIKKDKPELLLSLYQEISKGLLNLQMKEIEGLLEHFKNLILASVDSPTKKLTYLEKIKILKDLESKYKLNEVVVNELFFRYFKLSFDEKNLSDFLSYFITYKIFITKHKNVIDDKKLMSYVNIICDFNYDDECKNEIEYLSKLIGFNKLDNRLKEQYFYLQLKAGKLLTAYRVGLKIRNLHKSFDYLNPILSLVMITDADKVFKLLESKYILKNDLGTLLDFVEEHLIYRFVLDTKERSFLKRCLKLDPTKCKSFRDISESYLILEKFSLNRPLAFNNELEVVFETLGKQLSDNMALVQEETKRLEEMIKDLDPRVRSLGFFIGIDYYNDLLKIYAAFIPKSQDVELVAAITQEIKNISDIFSKKREEYIISSKKIRSKINDNTGASLMGLPLSNRKDLSTESGSLLLLRSQL